MKYIKDRKKDYNSDFFINELFEASKKLGVLEGKIDSYHFDNVLIPILHRKETIATMFIEGTQTTMSDVYKSQLEPQKKKDKTMQEVFNHMSTLAYGADYLAHNNFSNGFIQEIHNHMLKDIIDDELADTLGKYKMEQNKIVNSLGKAVFVPPTPRETKKYMDELINYMNDKEGDVNALIKAAIIHAQFESIHPFDDGNGRVGRLLVSLYLYKTRTINFPFFYISESISMEKAVYYNKLTSTREGDYSEWIKFFLERIIVQAEKQIEYIETLNNLYESTKHILVDILNSPKCESIIELLFNQPILETSFMADKLSISMSQANRYLKQLERHGILLGDDKQRNRQYYFYKLLDLAQY